MRMIIEKEKLCELFWSLTDIKDNECWNWKGYLFQSGYGGLWNGKTYKRVHRFAYEILVGNIADGLYIDHLCRNKKCVNPDHLEAVTPQENTIRGFSFAAKNYLKTQCQRGHTYDFRNTYKYKGMRICRACQRIRVKEYYQRKKNNEKNSN